MGESIEYSVEGSIATLTLNRPEQMNTLSQELLDETLLALQEVAADDVVRVLIITGKGRAFCAGGDLTTFAAGTGLAASGGSSLQTRVDRLRGMMRTSQLLREMPKVTIAAINGACAGAGLSWAAAADLRYAAQSARFNTAFLGAGLSGDFGGTWSLSRIVGPAKARELYLLAEKFTAEEAAAMGLVTRVLPDEELLVEVHRVAERLAAFAPLAVRAVKANLNDALEMSLAQMLDIEADRHTRLGATADAREAAAAFLEKRTPVFQGR
jgi:2-(1,2-epoxy-1,2-dihydrophenyl)acetyl-CoA isomerase